MTEEKQPSPLRQQFGDLAPKLVDYTDNVLFGDLWLGSELTPRDRSIVTITALISGGHTEQLPFHLNKARENGVTEEEVVGVITHLAFYAGWPRAMSAIAVAKNVFGPRARPCRRGQAGPSRGLRSRGSRGHAP